MIDTARRQRRSGGPPTVLFIDEVHRFSKTQQDSLLAAVEDRTVTLLAATTENPYFSVISPLLSRCVLLTLQPLDDDAVRGLLRRAVADERGLGGAVTLTPRGRGPPRPPRRRGRPQGADRAGGGGRLRRRARRRPRSTWPTAEQAVDVAAVRYDRDGDAHYDVTSAFIKSMRGSDVGRGAALAGPDAGRRRGRPVHRPADGHLRQRGRRHGRPERRSSVATAAAHAVEYVGLPEAQLNLAQAVIHMATAPKSNSATTAHRRGDGRRPGRSGRGGAARAARRALRRRPGARARHAATATRTTTSAAWSPSSTCRTTWSGPTTTSRAGTARSGRWPARLPLLRRIVRGLPAAGPARRAGRR